MKKSNHKPLAIRHQLTIGWLYPELMSTYGDRGNIIVLTKRCLWRGIDVEIKHLDVGFSTTELKKCDLLFMGGAQDQQQKIVSDDLAQAKVKTLKQMIDSGIPGLYICGAYQFLGKYYKEADGTTIPGLSIFDLYTENPGASHPRLIGNMIFDTDIAGKIVGFENHGGRTYLGEKIKPFGKIIKGFGNNGEDGTEGAVYKNSFGTYSHGPILPKNPSLADYLIQTALEKKYKKKIKLADLDDALETKAHDAIITKIS